MALSLIDTETASGLSAAPSVATPTHAAGDRLYVVINHNVETTTTADNNANTTSKQGEYPSLVAGRGAFAVFYRTLTASEPATFDYTLSTSERWSIIAWTQRGGGAAFHRPPGFGQDESSTAPTCPGVTTTIDNCWAFAIAGADGPQNGEFTGGPAGYTALGTVNVQQPMAIYYKAITPAGATGDQSFALTTAGDNNNYSLDVCAIAPAGAASDAWVGIYWVEFDSSMIPELITRGVTRFHILWPNTTVLNAVSAAGGKAWIELRGAFESGYDSGLLESWVTATKDNAAVEGYFTKDEADLSQYSIPNMQAAYADIKALTSKPVMAVIVYPYMTSPINGLPYTNADPPIADIIAPDPYIIPYGEDTQIATHATDSVNAMLASPYPDRPVYFVIQNFSWGIPPPGGFPLSPEARYPTVAEMTRMGVFAREAGVENLWIYTWHGDVEEPSLDFDEFNPTCYAALPDIIEAWLEVGPTPGPDEPDPDAGVFIPLPIWRRRRRR